MDVRELTLHATAANRDLDVVIYGRSGRQVLAFPEGDSSCLSWENNGLVDALSGPVDEGLVQLVCVDSLDDEAWHARGAVGSYRLENVQAFLSFVERDLPAVLASLSGEKAPTPPIAAGVGIGALNATLAVLRRPQDFSGLVALSGTYDVSRLLGQELDEDWRLLSPLDIVAGLTPRKKVTRLLRELPLAFVCGQEPSETGLDTQRELEELLTSKGVAATFEYWGYDVSHDWYWWREELSQLLPCLLEKDGLTRRALVARASRARSEAAHAAMVVETRGEELAEARRALTKAKRDAKECADRQKREEQVVLDRQDSAAKLAKFATDAWVERDRVQALLDDAIARGNAAQAKADAAAKGLSDAEWICGEARSRAQEAVHLKDEAAQRVQDGIRALEDAKEARRQADAALAQIEGDPR